MKAPPSGEPDPTIALAIVIEANKRLKAELEQALSRQEIMAKSLTEVMCAHSHWDFSKYGAWFDSDGKAIREVKS